MNVKYELFHKIQNTLHVLLKKGGCMKTTTIFLMTIICLTGIALYAQSLGELAKEEHIRRDAISSNRIIILEYTPPVLPVEEVSIVKPENEKDNDDENGNRKNTKSENNGDSHETAVPKEDTELFSNTESYWRNTMSDARNRLAQLENEANELTSRRNALQLQHNRTNGSRRGSIKDEIDRTVQDLEQNRKDMEQARKELQSLRDEARSSGALPGWIE